MKWLLGILGGLLACGAAHAQPVQVTPTVMHGQGTLAVSNSSVALNTLTLSPSSPAFPTGLPGPFLTIYVQPTSTANVTICWFGGACTAGTGIVLTPGSSVSRNLGLQNMTSASPTLICASANACSVSVEW